MPSNGYSHNLRSPPPPVAREHQGCRQIRKAAYSALVIIQDMCAAKTRSRLGRGSVRFRGLLGGVTRLGAARSPRGLETGPTTWTEPARSRFSRNENRTKESPLQRLNRLFETIQFVARRSSRQSPSGEGSRRSSISARPEASVAKKATEREPDGLKNRTEEQSLVMPSNGSAHNLRGPPKGFRRGYRARRQTARAAFSASAEMRRREVATGSTDAASGSGACYAARQQTFGVEATDWRRSPFGAPGSRKL